LSHLSFDPVIKSSMIQSMTSQAFAMWITGLPASGKSTIVSVLKPQLEAMGLAVEVLESDEVRRVVTPIPSTWCDRGLRCDGELSDLSGLCEVRDPSFHRGRCGMSPHDLHGARPERDLSKGPAGENLLLFRGSNLPTKRRSTRISESTPPPLPQAKRPARSATWSKRNSSSWMRENYIGDTGHSMSGCLG
jgi:hypothetical protein